MINLKLFIENHPKTVIFTFGIIGYIFFICAVCAFCDGDEDRDIRNALDDLQGKDV